MAKSFDNYRLDGCLFEETPVAAPELTVAAGHAFPERVDLRALCSPVENQGHVGSCAANAVVGALEYHQLREGRRVTDLSRLYVYYNARRLADKESEDVGTYIHHVMASIMAYGACPEPMWPYQEVMWSTKPTEDCYNAARKFGAVEYARTPLGLPCKAALAAGLPVVFGMLITETLMNEAAESGLWEVPRKGYREPVGGHAMLIVGYDDADRTWLVRNSWGAKYGVGGHVRIRYEVMQHFAMPTQFWTIGAISQAGAGLSLRGVSQEESQAAVTAAAPRQLASALMDMKAEMRGKLESDLDAKKKGIRDRLRGPGAGGGY